MLTEAKAERPKYPLEGISGAFGIVFIAAGPIFPPAYLVGGLLLGSSLTSVTLREFRYRDLDLTRKSQERVAVELDAREFAARTGRKIF